MIDVWLLGLGHVTGGDRRAPSMTNWSSSRAVNCLRAEQFEEDGVGRLIRGGGSLFELGFSRTCKLKGQGLVRAAIISLSLTIF